MIKVYLMTAFISYLQSVQNNMTSIEGHYTVGNIGGGSLCSETAIVFSFPGRAEALPGVGFSWEIGDSCRKSGQNQRFTGHSKNRPVIEVSEPSSCIPWVPILCFWLLDCEVPFPLLFWRQLFCIKCFHIRKRRKPWSTQPRSPIKVILVIIHINSNAIDRKEAIRIKNDLLFLTIFLTTSPRPNKTCSAGN